MAITSICIVISSQKNGLADMLNWTQTTFLRGQYKFNDSYVDKICNRLVGSMLIQGVFASVEKDRNEEHNHVLNFLFSHHLRHNHWFRNCHIR